MNRQLRFKSRFFDKKSFDFNHDLNQQRLKSAELNRPTLADTRKKARAYNVLYNPVFDGTADFPETLEYVSAKCPSTQRG